MDIILKYFKDLSDSQIEQYEKLEALYFDWNKKINVVSRKDIEELYIRHILHSLAIAKVIDFKPETSILDVGTGGGFPGIPLAILFPKCNFHLVDSINKKLNVVRDVAEKIDLENVSVTHTRAENLNTHYDFVVSRAVTYMPTFVGWVKNKIKESSINTLSNGILYLKGGDLSEELKNYPKSKCYEISNYFEEEFFETKKVVYLPI